MSYEVNIGAPQGGIPIISFPLAPGSTGDTFLIYATGSTGSTVTYTTTSVTPSNIVTCPEWTYATVGTPAPFNVTAASGQNPPVLVTITLSGSDATSLQVSVTVGS